jgi:hypothetical protein
MLTSSSIKATHIKILEDRKNKISLFTPQYNLYRNRNQKIKLKLRALRIKTIRTIT